MRFSCISLFPEIIQNTTEHSIVRKALERGLFEIVYFQIREHAVNDYGKVDDALYGGGTGMLLMAEPIFQTVREARAAYLKACEERGRAGQIGKEKLIYLSPRGKVLCQKLAEELRTYDHLILLSGHYEGVDQRVLAECEAEEVSIGDYVLSGGELAAAVLIDVVMRLLPGVLPDEEAWQQDSHSSGLLEENQYTRPAKWRGREVPAVLLSGHAARIEQYRRSSALENTLRQRPDLLQQYQMNAEEWLAFLEQEWD